MDHGRRLRFFNLDGEFYLIESALRIFKIDERKTICTQNLIRKTPIGLSFSINVISMLKAGVPKVSDPKL